MVEGIDLFIFIEEFRAARYATRSFRTAFSYAWNYPEIRKLWLVGQAAFPFGVGFYLAYQYYFTED
jgi:hypothetical protein